MLILLFGCRRVLFARPSRHRLLRLTRSAYYVLTMSPDNLYQSKLLLDGSPSLQRDSPRVTLSRDSVRVPGEI